MVLYVYLAVVVAAEPMQYIKYEEIVPDDSYSD